MTRLIQVVLRSACIAALPWSLLHAAENRIDEEVIVTGSYIRGTPEDAPSPVTTLNRDEIIASGITDISELALNLEVASGSDTAPQDGARFNGNSGSGLANISLRGLGPTSTLVLMDGKRLPFAGQKVSNGDRFVDINSIPITMIERVEVLKNGASATYGSDAIAGVVNFITRRDFEGFELSGKYQGVTEGDQNDATLGAIYGWSSDDSATHFVIGGEWLDRTELESRDRRDLRRDLFPKQDGVIVNRFAFTGVDPNCETLDRGFFPDNALNSDPNVCQRNGSDTEVMIRIRERVSRDGQCVPYLLGRVGSLFPGQLDAWRKRVLARRSFRTDRAEVLPAIAVGFDFGGTLFGRPVHWRCTQRPIDHPQRRPIASQCYSRRCRVPT